MRRPLGHTLGNSVSGAMRDGQPIALWGALRQIPLTYLAHNKMWLYQMSPLPLSSQMLALCRSSYQIDDRLDDLPWTARVDEFAVVNFVVSARSRKALCWFKLSSKERLKICFRRLFAVPISIRFISVCVWLFRSDTEIVWHADSMMRPPQKKVAVKNGFKRAL